MPGNVAAFSYIRHMRVAGIAANLTSAKRPTIRVVVVDDSSGSAAVERVEEIPSDNVDTVDQLFHAGRAIESRLKGLSVDRVVIRQADAMYASRKDGPRRRLEIEGAAAAAARAVVVETHLAAGKELGEWCGTSKADVDAAGSALVTAANEHAKYAEAAAAAFAGLAL
jgi:hypothetical protein